MHSSVVSARLGSFGDKMLDSSDTPSELLLEIFGANI